MESSPHMYDPNTQPGSGANSPIDRSSKGSGPSAPAALKVKNFPPHTVPGGSGAVPQGNHPGAVGELAELTSTEISLDLQGLIDDTHFGDDNLFGDLIDAKKNELNHGYTLQTRTSPTGSVGSSGHSSPGGQESPPSCFQQYRNTLAYLPGSVHSGASYNTQIPPVNNNNSSSSGHPPTSSGGGSGNVQVKQEPVEGANSLGMPPAHANSYSNPNNNSSVYSNGTVSSTTPGPPHLPPMVTSNGGDYSTPLPSLKSFSQAPKYLQSSSNIPLHMSKKKMDRNSDEYRRRRERNNVAVRKSREKAKARTRETEERVKILARENERLHKKVELLQEELTVLRSLFSNVGVLPEHVHRELSKHMDNFQQQHNAMACM